VLSDFDLQLLGEGTHQRSYEKLGAHLTTVQGVQGVHFAVWAPSARGVSVIGSFNRWDGRRHPMRALGSSGIWELFIPGLSEGTLYKFEVKSAFDQLIEKADPHAYAAELRPKSASVVWDIDKPTVGATRRGWNGGLALISCTSHCLSMRFIWVRDACVRRGEPFLYLPRAGSQAGRLRETDGVHAHRASSCDGAPAGCLLGLSSHRLFRAY